MIKVCHMTSAHSSEDVRIYYKECVSLAKAGYDVYEVARGTSYDKNGVHIVGVGNIPGNRLKRMTKGTKAVYKKALELDCDIYHFHDPELLPYGLKLKKKGKKVIFDSHENTLEQINEKTWVPDIVRKPLYYAFEKYQKRICSQFDAIISVTPHVCEYFKGINPNTFMITNYPILLPVVRNSMDKVSRSLCFAGGISQQWNHENILRAIEKINDCTYVLCGRGDKPYIEQLKELPAWEKVNYKGVLPHEEINLILSKSCIGLSILSYNHNTGFRTGTLGNTKIFEEMMAGIPVICTDFDLWKEFVERYHCGICVNPNNIDEIANAIKYLLDNPEEAKRMGENGRKAVEQEFNWNVEEKNLLELYKEVEKDYASM